MADIIPILNKFHPIGLDEMDGVNFMNRTDSKYLFNVDSLPALIESASRSYRVLEINNSRTFSYNTVYFDTEDYYLYNQHVVGKLGRYKVRVRTYETSGASYLEIKNKTNKGRTIKSRIRKKSDTGINEGKGYDFIHEIIPGDALKELHPMLSNRFTRVTLTNLEVRERITLDFNISFSCVNGKQVDMPFLAIAEIKRDKSSGLSPFYSEIKKMGIRETGFSKYCIGLSLLDDVPKKNVLKSKMLMLNKIKNESSIPVIG
ncbi:MAG TPA: polyphosphate polymerase domain-containing protein [Bacteroidales bacterium]|nr:polyphosphate polymerase domain-containing protein [Bacteroidales bacterium]